MKFSAAGLLALVAGANAANWVGDTSKFVGNSNFCNTCGNFGVPACDFICAGGGTAGGGSGCSDASPSPCSNGQYTFSAANGWTISMDQGFAKGVSPYREFAYCPFCHGSPMSTCWDGSAHNLKFSFKLNGFTGWGSYVKLLFWTDSFNLLGLLPAGAASAKAHGLTTPISLIGSPPDDYPQNWKGIMPLSDNVWYNVIVTLTRNAAGTLVNAITVNGNVLVSNVQSTVSLAGDSNGAQLGMYSFDFGGTYDSKAAALSLRDISFSSASGVSPGPTPGTPPSPKPTSPVPKPTSPVPKPTSPVPQPTSPVPKPTSPAPTPKTSGVCYCNCGCDSCYKMCDCGSAGAKHGTPFASDLVYGSGNCYCECPGCTAGNTCYAKCPCTQDGAKVSKPWVTA